MDTPSSKAFVCIMPSAEAETISSSCFTAFPSSGIHGGIAVIPSTVRELGRFIDAPYRELRIPDSGHWVQNEAVEEVNNALLEFLSEGS